MPPFDRDRQHFNDLARQVVYTVDLAKELNDEIRGNGGHGERIAGHDAHLVAVDRRLASIEDAARGQAGAIGRLIGLAELAFADVFVRRALVTIVLVLVLGGGGVTAVLAYLSPGEPHATSP